MLRGQGHSSHINKIKDKDIHCRSVCHTRSAMAGRRLCGTGTADPSGTGYLGVEVKFIVQVKVNRTKVTQEYEW